MHLEELDLIKYGVFSDCHLDLSAPGVHLVVGPNGAGKSTARSAVTDTLYGIPRQTGYGFLHDMRELRLGAKLHGSSGQSLTIVRLKKDRDALRTPDGAVLDQDRLASFLGGISREEFTSTFAIDRDELQAGAQALLAGKGDLAKALFESRSSVRLTEVLADLQEQSANLYVKGGQKRELNRALGPDGPLAKARHHLQTSLLHPEMYHAALREVEAHTKHKDQVTEELGRARGERDRLTRIKQAYPVMQQRSQTLTDRDRLLAAGPLLGPGVAEQYRTLCSARDKTRAALENLGETVEETSRILEGLADQPAVLAQIDAIDALHTETKAIRALERNVTEARTQAAQWRSQAARALEQIGAGSDPAAAPPPPGPAVHAALNLLISAKHQLDAEVNSARNHAAGRTKALHAQHAKLDALPQVASDPVDLRTVIKTVPKDLTGRIDAQRRSCQAAARKLQRALARANPALGQQIEIATAVLPSGQIVAELREQARTARQTLAALESRRAEHAKALTDGQRKLQQFLRRDPPPNEEQLAATRTRRDTLWAEQLRPRLLAPGPHPTAPPVAEFEQAHADSDELADRMRREARRLAERTQLEDAVEAAGHELADLDDQLGQARAQIKQLEGEWAHLWTASHLTAPSIDEGADLLASIRTLQELHDEHDQLLQALESDTATAETHCASLRAELAKAEDQSDLAETGLARLLELAEERHSALTDQIKKRATVESKIEELTLEAAAASERVEALEDDLATWGRQWSAFLTEQRLPAASHPDQVAAELNELEQIHTLNDRAQAEDSRATRDQVQIDDYATRLDEVLQSLERARPQTPTQRSAAMTSLKKLADAAVEIEAKRRACKQDLDGLATRHEVLTDRERQHAADIAALLAQHKLTDEAELIDAIERAKACAALVDQLTALERGLMGTGVGLAQLEQELTDYDVDQVEAALAHIEERIKELEADQSRLGNELALLEQDVRTMNNTATAAGAASDLAHELAAITERAQDYLRLRLAERILLESIETYRTQNQTPLLKRAEAYFGQLTCGRYPHLLDDADPQGQPVLRTRRSGGRIVDVDELSEGERDQLYLALRLASLDQHVDAGRSMPLILDDVFITFDDDRAAAGFTLLAELSSRLQVIVLTHHAHLIQIASHALPPDTLHVHHLRTES